MASLGSLERNQGSRPSIVTNLLRKLGPLPSTSKEGLRLMTLRDLLLPSFSVSKGQKESQATRHPDANRVCAVQGWTILSQVLVFLNQGRSAFGCFANFLMFVAKRELTKDS